MSSRIMVTAATPVPLADLPGSGARAGSYEVPDDDMVERGIAYGLWEHSVGTSQDLEVDEVFVVLSGRACIEVEGGADLEIGPGDVVRLTAGTRTVWHVREPLRKFWVVPA